MSLKISIINSIILRIVKPSKIKFFFVCTRPIPLKLTISAITIYESGIVFGEARDNLNSAIILSGTVLTAYLPQA